MNYIIYADGGSRGNPGHAGSGAVIMDIEGIVIKEISEYVGIQTNNYAEYSSLLFSLQECINLGINQTKIEVFMDSKLVVEQVNKRWKVKSDNIKLLYLQIMELLKFFNEVSISHIPREKNTLADSLANKAMDNYLGTFP
jgi:ribonuclease HI